MTVVPDDEPDTEKDAEAKKKERPMTIEEAARKGGNTTKERYGPDFYSRIGRKGGQRVARERGPEFYSEIGRKGGEARVAQSRRLEHLREPEGGSDAGGGREGAERPVAAHDAARARVARSRGLEHQREPEAAEAESKETEEE